MIYRHKLNIQLAAGAIKPSKAYDNSSTAGYDLYSSINTLIKRGEITKIPTGVRMEIPRGYVGLIWDKSGMGAKGFKVFGGVIDADYRGEIQVLITNLSEEETTILRGQKVAQILIQTVEDFELVEVDELGDTTRSNKGFGSSGN